MLGATLPTKVAQAVIVAFAVGVVDLGVVARWLTNEGARHQNMHKLVPFNAPNTEFDKLIAVLRGS